MDELWRRHLAWLSRKRLALDTAGGDARRTATETAALRSRFIAHSSVTKQ